MKAWLLPGTSDVTSMQLQEVLEPKPNPGEIVLAVRFAALNPADRYLSIGQYPAKPEFPHVLGRDGVGIVQSVGPGVSGIRPGDTRLILRSEVGVNRWGTLAQRVAVEAAYTVEVPPGWSLEEAAAAPLVYVTAWQALTQWGVLPRDSVVLVTGASGGVGVATVQLAHAMGHTVIALSRSAEKAAVLKRFGAWLTVDPQEKKWRDIVKEQLGKRRVDLAVDNIGGEAFSSLIDLLAMHGRVSVVGRLAGPVPNFNTASLFFRRIRIGGVAIGTYTLEESQEAWKGVLQTLEKGHAKPLVDRVFPFQEVPQAFQRLAEGPMGKVVIAVPQP